MAWDTHGSWRVTLWQDWDRSVRQVSVCYLDSWREPLVEFTAPVGPFDSFSEIEAELRQDVLRYLGSRGGQGTLDV